MNKRDFVKLVGIRESDAQILLASRRYDGSAYMIGYAIECGLKAIIASQTKRGDYPDKDFVHKIYTHKLETLTDLAGLKTDLRNQMNMNINFSGNWLLCRGWSEQRRYTYGTSRQDAVDLVNAATDSINGVLPWIKQKF
jgi:hypothetical protein